MRFMDMIAGCIDTPQVEYIKPNSWTETSFTEVWKKNAFVKYTFYQLLSKLNNVTEKSKSRIPVVACF